MRSKRVLLVDDEAPVRAMLGIVLERAGFEVIQAGGGREALEKATQEGPVDLVVTDVAMPDLDGIHLVDRLIESKLAHSVVFISGYCDERAVREQMQKCRSAEFVPKPFAVPHLLKVVRQMLGDENGTARHAELRSRPPAPLRAPAGAPALPSMSYLCRHSRMLRQQNRELVAEAKSNIYEYRVLLERTRYLFSVRANIARRASS